MRHSWVTEDETEQRSPRTKRCQRPECKILAHRFGNGTTSYWCYGLDDGEGEIDFRKVPDCGPQGRAKITVALQARRPKPDDAERGLALLEEIGRQARL